MKNNKLNNRGFAISTALYGLLTLTMLILVLIFQINRTDNNNSKELGESIQMELEGIRACVVTKNLCENNREEDCSITYNSCINNIKNKTSE